VYIAEITPTGQAPKSAAIVTARTDALSGTTSSELATWGGPHAAVLTVGIVCLTGAAPVVAVLRRPVAQAG
jgi:hypothetical protein